MTFHYDSGSGEPVSEKSKEPSIAKGFRAVITENGVDTVIEDLPSSLAARLAQEARDVLIASKRFGLHVARLDALILDLGHAKRLLPRLPDVFVGSHDADLITRSEELSRLHGEASAALAEMISLLWEERAWLVAPETRP